MSGDSGGNRQALQVANPKYTLPRARLKGSPACLNCGTALQGPFCHYCGQPDRNFLRFFPVLLRELMSDFLDFDSRFARTLKPLLFHPGRLTRDYLDGRRYRYTPPLRLYLFASIVFFLVAATMSSDAMRIQAGDQAEATTSATDSVTQELKRELAGELGNLTPEERQAVEKVLERLPADPGATAENDVEVTGNVSINGNGLDMGAIQFGDEPWDRETNPLRIPLLPDRLNDWINDEIAESPRKTEAINANPDVIVQKVFDLLPGTMFVLLPVVALIFKFWYLFARRYYIEHLVFALHNHAFIFVALLLAFLFGLLGDWLGARGITWASSALGWGRIAMFVWIPLYLLVSLRVVYRQGWFLTLCKYGVIGVSYVVLLGVVTTFVAALGFLLL